MSIAEKLTTIAENEQKVFDSGKQAEYDKFWDSYQENGNRTNYEYCFSGRGWNDETFKPKYDMVVTISGNMFSFCGVTDMIKALENAGVKLDLSKAVSTSYLLQSTLITRFPTIDTSSRKGIDYFLLGNIALEYVEKIILKSDGSQTFNAYSFLNNQKLKDIYFEGVIGQNGFDISSSPLLSKASIESIINALSTVTSGLTVTLSKTAVNNAFETSVGASDGSTSQEWLDLIATKPNWTISLV